MKAWLVLAALFTLGFGEALAQSDSDSRIARLEETIRVLELRVAALEERLRTTAPQSGVTSERANWRKLKIGMVEADVERLLGSPIKVDNYGSFTVWYYGPGNVEFSRSRKVQGWSEP